MGGGDPEVRFEGDVDISTLGDRQMALPVTISVMSKYLVGEIIHISVWKAFPEGAKRPRLSLTCRITAGR